MSLPAGLPGWLVIPAQGMTRGLSSEPTSDSVTRLRISSETETFLRLASLAMSSARSFGSVMVVRLIPI